MKAAEEEPAGTVTEAGRERAGTVLVRATDAPPVGAGLERVTVQEELALGARVEGEH